MFIFPLTKSSQQGKIAREKQYFQYWILRFVVFTRFRANRDFLLKLYVNEISKNSFLWALLGNTCLQWAYFIWLAEGVATILCCCAKLVFMLLTISLWRRAELLKLWIAASMVLRNVILRSQNQLAWQLRYNNFCKIYKKIESRPAVNLFLLHFYFRRDIVLYAVSCLLWFLPDL